MSLVIDAAPLVALADRSDRMQSVVERTLREEVGTLIVPAPVTAEVDSMLSTRVGRSARLAFIDDIAAGRFHVMCLDADDHAAIASLERRYSDLDAGLADLSIVIAARRAQTTRVLAFDERHFRVLEPVER